MHAPPSLALPTDVLLRLRADTPALQASGHFNHGSCSLPPHAVFDALRNWFEQEARYGTLAALERNAEALVASRQAVAKLLGARPTQIAFTPSASHGWALAARALHADSGAHIITTRQEWGGNALAMLAESAARRLTIHPIQAVAGDEPLAWLDAAIAALPAPARRASRSVWALSLQAVSAGFGGVLEWRGIAERVHAAGGLLFVDASHALGQTVVDVATIGCDVLVFPTRKWLRGPKGIGVLYLSDRALAAFEHAPLPDVSNTDWQSDGQCLPRADARRFEIGEFNPGLRLAAGAAARYATEVGMPAIETTVRRLAAGLAQRIEARTGLCAVEARLPGMHPQERAEPSSNEITAMCNGSGMLTYRLSAGNASTVAARMLARGFRIGTVAPATMRWLFGALGEVDILRLTPHYITPPEQVDALIDVLADVVGELTN